MRMIHADQFKNTDALAQADLTPEILALAVNHTYRLVDAIDAAMLDQGERRMGQLVELANLSSMIGNLLRSGIMKASKGMFKENGPHKYPDLLHQRDLARSVEIKMVLETKNPKGHLPKPGYHLACRWVLCDENGKFTTGKVNRGTVPWIWELRFGYLDPVHFNLSNTTGDSGKTANVNKTGMAQLRPVFFDQDRCPFKRRYDPYKPTLMNEEEESLND